MTPNTKPCVPRGNWITPGRAQFAIIIAALLIVATGIGVGSLILEPLTDETKEAPPTKPERPSGTFRTTRQEWAGLKLERVTTRTFRPEHVTEGTIAIDNDLTTPVFCHYSGHVMKLIAKLGDHVEPGAPLFEIEASEFVQAQNDLTTALANLQTARSQLELAHTNEKRGHELYMAKGGALKDWQQAQTNLITAQNIVRADDIALAAVRNRLRILGRSDEEIASLEAQPTQKLNAVTIVTAPIDHPTPGRDRSVRRQLSQWRHEPGLYNQRSIDGMAGRQRPRGGCPIVAYRPPGRGAGASLARPCLESEDLLGGAIDRSEYAPPSRPGRCRKSERRAQTRDVCEFQHHRR
jgi:hypothetical protein